MTTTGVRRGGCTVPWPPQVKSFIFEEKKSAKRAIWPFFQQCWPSPQQIFVYETTLQVLLEWYKTGRHVFLDQIITSLMMKPLEPLLNDVDCYSSKLKQR